MNVHTANPGLKIRDVHGFTVTIQQHDDPYYGMNVTPKYTFVDLHVDLGMEALCTSIGDCVKFWVLYPPTRYNLHLFYSVCSDAGRMPRIANELEGGIAVIAGSEITLMLPAATIHCVWTIEGGILAGTLTSS